MQRSTAPGPLTAIIDQHLQELANSGFNSGRRTDGRGGGIGKPRGFSPSRSGPSPGPTTHSPPPSVRRPGSFGGSSNVGGSTRTPLARHSSPSRRPDDSLRPPRPKQAADGSPEPRLSKSRPGPVASSTPAPRTMRKAQSERSLRDPLTPGLCKSRPLDHPAQREAPSMSWWNVRTSGIEPGSVKGSVDDPGLIPSSSKFQPLLKSNSKARTFLDHDSLFSHTDRFSSVAECGEWLHKSSLERAEWLQMELSELQRRYEELERHSHKDAEALADMVVENDKLKAEKDALLKEKAQMEEVFEQIKEQRREEKTVTELYHEREKQQLKQEVLNLKALVKESMDRQEEAVKRTALARKSDKRYADNLVNQLSEVREQHRVSVAQHSEEMQHLTADLTRAMKERDLLSSRLQASQKQPPPGTEDGQSISAISSAWEPIGDSGPSRKEMAVLKLKVLALKRALRSQHTVLQQSWCSSSKQGAHNPTYTVPTSNLMDMLAHEREAMERKYAEHFALLMSAVGNSKHSENSLGDDGTQRSHSGPGSPTVFDIEAPRGSSGKKEQDGNSGSPRGAGVVVGVTANPADMLDQLKRENEELRRRYGI